VFDEAGFGSFVPLGNIFGQWQQKRFIGHLMLMEVNPILYITFLH
jgi:hypothetical protein